MKQCRSLCEAGTSVAQLPILRRGGLVVSAWSRRLRLTASLLTSSSSSASSFSCFASSFMSVPIRRGYHVDWHKATEKRGDR
jgi:hypothetical protein